MALRAGERRWATDGAVAGAALAVAIATGLVAGGGDVPAWEEDAFRAVNDLPDGLEPLMTVFQYAGLLLVPVGVAVVAAAFRRWRLAVALVALVPLKLLVEKGVVKQLVERQRPGTSICEGDRTCAAFRDVPIEGLSFVSGHAIIAWGVATLVLPHLGRAGKAVVIALAAANSVARIYLGAHNPLDVVGGAAVGVTVASLLHLLVADVPPPATDADQRALAGQACAS